MDVPPLRSISRSARRRAATAADQVEAIVVAPHEASAALATVERMKPGDLQALCLRGAKAGIQHLADLLEKGLASGALKPRDLAVVAGILTDKAIKLEPLVREQGGAGPQDGLGQLDELTDEILRMRAELKRRDEIQTQQQREVEDARSRRS